MSDETNWMPLSVRRGLRGQPAMHEGVPGHLATGLTYWLEDVFGYRKPGGMNMKLMLRVASALEIPIANTLDGGNVQTELFQASARSEDLLLDLVDAALRFSSGSAAALREALHAGRSVWTLSDDARSLTRRVDATSEAAYRKVLEANDAASLELAEAWHAAYGREENPSDAWDHSIKAVEAVLIPIVCPKQSKPTLGHVLGALRADASAWELALTKEAHGDATPFTTMLELIWPNPDRHGSPEEQRQPSVTEARAVVHLAVTLVEWTRQGCIGKTTGSVEQRRDQP